MKKCGVILFNQDTHQYLLVHGKKSQKWGFPKGHMEYGETEEETALREFHEETGLQISQPLKRKIRFRNNIYFLVSVRAHEVPSECPIQDQAEIEMARWFSEGDILKLRVDDCNFGLKNWINQYLLLPNSYGHYQKHLLDCPKSENPSLIVI